KERNKLIKKAEKAVENAEKKVMELEMQIAEIESKLATPSGANDTTLFTQYGELKNKLSEAEAEWTEACLNLEEMQG
ncbi:MAG: ABC transporter ATP-binding protein, partial [Bacteroidaceae bacterium]|nr:ABC transporter ATP-binding protein [Bacteroidaceae bacterium]